MEPIVASLVLGVLHFLIGGIWYSPVGFAQVWIRGLGVTRADIDEARINVKAALAASALASIVQAAVLVMLVQALAPVSIVQGALLGSGIAFAFAFLPMLKDRVWADRAWSVIAVDAGYEIAAAALIGGLSAWWLG
jgi:hypothetical protein